MEEIRYLNQKEKRRTRKLYELAFPEDSEEFVDYYYQWKAIGNQILVMEEEKRIQVMLHLNPYPIWICGHRQEVPYIVAVATEPDCRRQGKMERVMKYALQDLERRKIPFAFLLPADPAYYLGQGFVFFSENPSEEGRKDFWELQAAEAPYSESEMWHAGKKTRQEAEALHIEKEMPWTPASLDDIPEIVEFSNHTLQKRYHIFIRRDEAYYQRLFAELKTEQGGILLQRRAGTLEGVLAYGMEQPAKAEVRELLLPPDSVRRKEALSDICKTALPGCDIHFAEFEMMFRIASLKEFVIRLKSGTRLCYEVKVTDPVIPSNCGCFRIEIGKNGGRIQEISREKVRQELDISALARILARDLRVHLGEWV